MIKLVPLKESDFDTYYEENIVQFAEENVKNGHWGKQEALEKSRAAFRRFLPDGLQSKNQFIFNIFDEEQKNKLGILWFEVKIDEPNRPAFVYDFVIDEQYRGKGFGKKTLITLDEKLKEMGAKSVALHVFGHNTVAFELYKKMGYEVTNINMKKVYE